MCVAGFLMMSLSTAEKIDGFYIEVNVGSALLTLEIEKQTREKEG